MGETLAQAAAREFGFDPAEKRGKDGKWTHVGGMIKGLVGKESSNPLDRAAEHGRGGGASNSKLGTPWEHVGLKNKTETEAAEMWESGKLQKRGVQFKELPYSVRSLVQERAGGSKGGEGRLGRALGDVRRTTGTEVDPGSHSQRKARDYLNAYGDSKPAARRLIAAELLRGTPIEEVAAKVKKETGFKG